MFIFCILSGCGTISGNSEIISVDTSMKDVSVYEVDEMYRSTNIDTESLYRSIKNKNAPLKNIGKTPIFYKTHRSYSKTYILEKDGILSQEFLNCSIRWKESVFPNIAVSTALYFINPIVSLASLGVSSSIDAISGSIFDCNDRVFFSFPDKYVEKYIDNKEEYKRKEARFILVPLASKNKKVSQKYTEKWKTLNIDKLKKYFKKISFVPDSFVRQRLEVYGIDLESDPDTFIGMDSFLSSKILELGFLTNATHIIFINKIDNKIESSIIDIHILDDISSKIQPEPLVLDNENITELSQKKWYFSFMKFFPNSVTFSFPISSYIRPQHHLSISKNDVIYEYDLDSKEDKTSLLKRSFSGFGLNRVEHFKKYNIIDISFLLYFNINFISENVLLSYLNKDSTPKFSTIQSFWDNGKKEEKKVDIKVSYSNMILANNIGFSLHTAIGAINTLLILGPSLEKYGVDSFSGGLNFVYGLKNEWNYFINDDLFIYCSGSLYKYLKKNRKVSLEYKLNNSSKDFKVFSLSSSYYVKIGIGYYFGNTFRDKIISLVD